MHVIDILLTEAPINGEKYIPAINQLLKKRGVNLPLQPATKEFGNSVVDFFPVAGQQISNLDDQIKGKLNGKLRWFSAKKIFKSDELKNLLSGKDQGTVNINQGELTEGYHATAAFARLIKRPLMPITVKDVVAIINRLQNSKTLVIKKPEAESDIADEFHLTITLKPASWDAFKDPATIARLGKIFDSIISDANEETGRFADRFATNQRFDLARIIGDGVSEESVKKTDIRFENHTEKKWADFSLKVGTTKQIHQVGGGPVVDSPKHKKATPEERYHRLAVNLFAVDNKFPLADISSIKPQFLKARSNEQMQRIAYKAAVDSFNQNLQTDTQEKHFFHNLVGALKYWMGRDEPDIKLKQFTTKGTYILDPHKIDQMINNDQIDLVAFYVEGDLPKIIIGDKISGKPLVSIRTYRNGKGYIRNYIEKEQLWIDLTLVKHIPNTTTKQTKTVAKTDTSVKPQALSTMATQETPPTVQQHNTNPASALPTMQQDDPGTTRFRNKKKFATDFNDDEDGIEFE